MRIVVHVDYNKETAFAADIAIVFLEYAIAFGKRAQKAILVRTRSWRKKSEHNFYVTGWGMIRVSNVMLLDATVIEVMLFSNGFFLINWIIFIKYMYINIYINNNNPTAQEGYFWKFCVY